MTKIILFSIFLLTLNCSTNKVSNIHGYRFLETKQEKIISERNVILFKASKEFKKLINKYD